MTYPSLLNPASVEIMALLGQEVAVPKVQLTLRQWEGGLIGDTFGNKSLIDFAGKPVFAELCVYELFRLSGWEARWIETYGAPAMHPKMLVNWQDMPRREQTHQPITETWVSEALQLVAAANGGTFSGCWDVLGWHDKKLIFAELKRAKKDRIRTTQVAWLEAGLKVGLQPENFMLVEWDFNSK